MATAAGSRAGEVRERVAYTRINFFITGAVMSQLPSFPIVMARQEN